MTTDIQELLTHRRALRREMLYSVGHEAYKAIEAKIEALDKLIPWVQYRITGANVEQRRDAGSWEFQDLRTDLDVKPLSEWTVEELETLPWHIEDTDQAMIEKI